MIVEEVFDKTIYPNMKQYVETNSIYSPLITKAMPQESKKFPIAPTKLLPITNQFNNLNYGEETYTFGINIDVYAIDQTIDGKKVSKRTICDEVTKWVIDYFNTNFRVTIKNYPDVSNADSNVHRNNIKISGKLDTKYGLDKLVIYPN